MLLASGLQTSWAYSYGGPIGNGGDAWQTGAVGYGLAGALNAPKNLGEEFRRNTPVVYWACDANFHAGGFFGSDGLGAVSNAFVVLNSLTNVDNYSQQLSEFPLESRHVNYTAMTLGLLDLKSFVLGAMMEQLGLADPVRYTWTLHAIAHVGPVACPVGMEHLVVQRNFDFVSSPLNQLQYSPYVNDTLYSYNIVDLCPAIAGIAEPFSVDPLADVYSPMASFESGSISWGGYFTGLTRDDVAGLRSLFTTNNVNMEQVVPGALLLTTNLGAGAFITSSNLNTLLVTAQTTDPALIPGLFPGVTVTSSSNYPVIISTPIIVAYFTNYIGSPYGSLPVFVVATNGYTYTPALAYVDTFGNVITNANLTNTPNIVLAGPNIALSYYTNTPATVVTVTVGPGKYGQPYPPVNVTNTTVQYITQTNAASGEYLVVPAGQCGWKIISVLLTNVVASTNLMATATNTVTTGTNTTTTSSVQSIVTYFTNHTFWVEPINCVQSTPAPGLYEGIERMQYVYAPYDSTLGQYWQPVTNNYTMTLVTNSQTLVQNFQRIVVTPDFIFSAFDDTAGFAVFWFSRNLNFDTTQVLPGLAGPGTINPSTTISFNKVGPVYFNEYGDTMDGTPYFTENPGSDLTDLFYGEYFIWASFDGTTNAPVVYPDGTSAANLENQVLIQISPSTIPNGNDDMTYSPVTISATGGAFTQPYTWSASGLPSGLTLVSNPDSTATLSGTPEQTGTFDFILTLTDYVGRSVQWGYTITITP